VRRAWLALSVGLIVASCDDVDVHILSGNQYNAALGCVTPSEGVDVLQGPSNGDNCSPECLVASGDDQTYVYVTTVCPPYAADYTSEALDAADDPSDPCYGALGAFSAFEDSGYVCPASPGDGGADAPSDAPTDAPSDAPADVAPDTEGD
jgi:hypothetical protein